MKEILKRLKLYALIIFFVVLLPLSIITMASLVYNLDADTGGSYDSDNSKVRILEGDTVVIYSADEVFINWEKQVVVATTPNKIILHPIHRITWIEFPNTEDVKIWVLKDLQ